MLQFGTFGFSFFGFGLGLARGLGIRHSPNVTQAFDESVTAR